MQKTQIQEKIVASWKELENLRKRIDCACLTELAEVMELVQVMEWAQVF